MEGGVSNVDTFNYRYMLVTFNDFGKDIKKNVKVEVKIIKTVDKVANFLQLQVDTQDVEAFGKATASLKFESYNGGRDSRERLTQVQD